MLTAYFFLFITAAVLIGFSIEALIKGLHVLNVASALFFLILGLIIGTYGVKEYLIRLQYENLAVLATRLHSVFILFFGPSAYFVSMYFPKGEVSERNRSTVLWLFLITLILAIFPLLGWDVGYSNFQVLYRDGVRRVFGLVQNHNAIYYLSLLYLFLLTGSAVFFILRKYKKVKLIYQKKQIRYFIFGMVSAFLLYGMLFLFEKWIPPLIQVFGIGVAGLILGGFLFYSIVRYRFTNMRLLLQRYAVEFLLGFMLSLPIVILFLGLRKWLVGVPVVFYVLIMAPGLYFLFRVYNSLMNLGRKLVGISEAEEDITGKIMTEIGLSHHLDELSRNIADWILENMGAKNVEVLTYAEASESYGMQYSALSRKDSVSAIAPIFRYLSSDIAVYDREQIVLDPKFSTIRPFAERYFSEHRCQLLLPVYYEEHPVLLIHIDSKIDGQAYDRGEWMSFIKLSRVLHVLIQNLVLFSHEQESRLTVRDLNIASNIQQSLYQKEIPDFANIDVYAYQKPAKWVNGDYYHVGKVADDEMALVVADVSGKGVPAALVAMMIHSVVKSQEFEATSTNAIVSKMNDVMASNQSSGSMTGFITFATVFCGFLDHRQRTLYYTNAGHFPMIVYDRKKDSIHLLEAHARPVGIFADVEYPTLSYEYGRDQVMVLYTDGITEATNHEEEEFGEERLLKLIRKNSGQSSTEITDAILNELSAFTAGLDQFDDITLIVIKL